MLNGLQEEHDIILRRFADDQLGEKMYKVIVVPIIKKDQTSILVNLFIKPVIKYENGKLKMNVFCLLRELKNKSKSFFLTSGLGFIESIGKDPVVFLNEILISHQEFNLPLNIFMYSKELFSVFLRFSKYFENNVEESVLEEVPSCVRSFKNNTLIVEINWLIFSNFRDQLDYFEYLNSLLLFNINNNSDKNLSKSFDDSEEKFIIEIDEIKEVLKDLKRNAVLMCSIVFKIQILKINQRVSSFIFKVINVGGVINLKKDVKKNKDINSVDKEKMMIRRRKSTKMSSVIYSKLQMLTLVQTFNSIEYLSDFNKDRNIDNEDLNPKLEQDSSKLIDQCNKENIVLIASIKKRIEYSQILTKYRSVLIVLIIVNIILIFFVALIIQYNVV